MTSASGHETRDVSPRWVLLVGAAFVALLLATGAGMLVLESGLVRREDRQAPEPSPLAAATHREPPSPQLQTDPSGDLARLRQWESERLDGTGWVDRNAGTVHIPIEQAMKLLVERSGGEHR